MSESARDGAAATTLGTQAGQGHTTLGTSGLHVGALPEPQEARSAATTASRPLTLSERLENVGSGGCPCGGRFKWNGVQTRCDRCDAHEGWPVKSSFISLVQEAAEVVKREGIGTLAGRAEAALAIAERIDSEYPDWLDITTLLAHLRAIKEDYCDA